jgi:sortase A
MTYFRCRSPLLFALAFALVFGSAAIALTPGRAQGQSSVPSLVVAPPNVAAHRVAPQTGADVVVAERAVEPTVPPLPVPAPLPNAAARVPLVVFGRIQIPKIGLDQVVHEGVEQMVIDAGPAHWPGTAAFGSWGNVVLAGHRTTHTEPFLRVAELVPGDPIILSDAEGTYTYHVTGIEIVPNTALSIVDQHPGRSLTIFSCHPIGSSAQRIVVHAELMSAPRPGQ